jgi:hypothetical protein
MQEADIKSLKVELEYLRIQLSIIDRTIKVKQKGSLSGFEFLVFQKDVIKIRIDSNQNHFRPHIHVDYGTQLHALSVCIKTGKILAGTISNTYLKEIINWTLKIRICF